MSQSELEFHGLVTFAGFEFMPKDVPMGVNEIREWAMKQGLITDTEFQLLHQKKIQKLSKCFSSQDELLVAIAIHEDSEKKFYMEYPYVPVKTLIKKGNDIQIVYWSMRPTSRTLEGKIVEYGEVSFGFWYLECSEELCTISNAKKVAAKFDELYAKLADEYETKLLKDGVKDISVDGDIRAKFFKEGRYFDVNLSREK